MINRIRIEIRHFTSLPEKARLLSISYFLRAIAYPMLSLFTSAFIWQQSNNVILLILYYIGNFSVLPMVFIVNRWLLGHFRLVSLYGIGTMLTGVSALFVIFQKSQTPFAYLLYGMLYGVGNGIYWANRNFLTLRHTEAKVRSYFTGLHFSFMTLSSIAVPVAAGWFIVWSHAGYQSLVIAAFAILVVAGLLVQKTQFEQPILHDGRALPFSPIWKKARLLAMAIGIVDVALYILPPVLMLKTLGNEGILGTVTSIMAIVTAGVTYIFGRKQKRERFLPVFTVLIVAFIIAGAPLMIGLSALAVLWYMIVTGVADNLIWTANAPHIMDMQDEEVKRSKSSHYRLIVDYEWFINVGRIGGLVLFRALALYDQTMALRGVTVVCGVVALALVYTLRTMPNEQS